MSAKRELANEARDLYANKAFLAALERLHKAWVAELVNAADSTERKLELIAQMRALDAIPGALKAIIAEYEHPGGRRAP